MNRLREIQGSLMRDIYAGERQTASLLDHNIDNAAERIDIYHNNTLLGLTGTLANIYPVTQKIVGEGFFKTVARFYIKDRPLDSGNRNGFGHDMSLFLKNFEPAKNLPYLPDIAAIESAFFLAGIAPDRRFLSAEDIGRRSIASPDGFKVDLHPSAQIVAQSYNGLQIWQEHKKENIGEIELVKKHHTVLCWRDQNHDVFFKAVSEDVERLLEALFQYEPFSKALEETLSGASAPEVFQQEFAQLSASGLFVNHKSSTPKE